MENKVKYQLKYTLLVLASLFLNPIFSQDFEPRSMSETPLGANVFVASYAHSNGNILLETALPIENLESEINSAVFGYARSFKLFSKPAKVDVIAPYAFANFSGLYDSRDSSAYRQGLGDPSIRLSMILIGAEALKPDDFLSRDVKRFRLGILARARLPIGQYNNKKLINLGTNRYSLRLGLAGAYSFTQKLTAELHFNSWFFTQNNEFYNGNTLKQKPMITLQAHLIYEFNPRMWAAISYGKTNLGETVLNEEERNDTQKNTRSGFAFSYRINKKHSLKLAFATGVTTRYGSDYTTLALAYQYLWFDKAQ